VTEKSVIRNDPCPDFGAKTATEASVTAEGMRAKIEVRIEGGK
jgi:hypothetical protein